MTEAEQYYNECMRIDDMKPFNELNEAEKEFVEKTWGYAFFKAQKALEQAREDLKNTLSDN